MIAYFDASALVKLLVDEDGSDDAAALWDAAHTLVCTRVAYAEVRAALAAAHRDGRLNSPQLRSAKRSWERFWDAMRVIELDPDLDEPSGRLAEAHALSGFDAIHLASALLLGLHDVVVATWDARLWQAASAMGYAMLPASRN